jgi:hypothetical protein
MKKMLFLRLLFLCFTALGCYSAIGGGMRNSIDTTSAYSFIWGGTSNSMVNTACHNFIGGGQDNIISDGSWSTIVGGRNNTVSAAYSSILGGRNNVVQPTHTDSAVFGNGIISQAPDTFHVSCLNAVGTPLPAATLPAGSIFRYNGGALPIGALPFYIMP